jgi:AcrR family transcriptional regulator
MTDFAIPDGVVVTAALRLASERPWRDVRLIDIAESAGTDLATLRRRFVSKGAILAAFARQIDDVVLAAARRPAEGQSPRDALFEVVMSRLDALAPHRAALKSIAADTGLDPALIAGFLSSQAGMLDAAGIDTDGIEGRVKVAGLASVYASVLRTWLDDDDPGLARTMAALDRRLRRGERALEAVDSVVSRGRSVLRAVMGSVGPGRN